MQLDDIFWCMCRIGVMQFQGTLLHILEKREKNKGYRGKKRREKKGEHGFTGLCAAVGSGEAEKLHLGLLVSWRSFLPVFRYPKSSI